MNETLETMERPHFTKKVFWENPYLTELKAVVTGVEGNKVTLDQTIFYAFSGGQESDEGTIGDRHVLEAKKEGKNIVYIVEGGESLKTGDEVVVNIEWERRYKLMKLHFAAEIVLELIYKKFPDIEKIGAHISADKARISFKYEGNLADVKSEIEDAANKIIDDNEAIESAFSDEENERRYWEIAGFGKVPCGGTHLKSTGEIGQIELKRKTEGKGKERIDIYLKTA
jgi:Ser-tRNA(Ala) deacylase AlaX